MQIKIEFNKAYKEPEIIILTDKMTDDIDRIFKMLSDEKSQIIAGIKNDRVEVLEPNDIIRVYANSKRYLLLRIKGSICFGSDFMRQRNG